MRIKFACLAVASSLVLGGCAYNGMFGGLSLGYGSPSYYDRYYDPRYRSMYGPAYWGWHDGFYYPGHGIYVYDRWRQAHLWNELQRRYWLQRLAQARARSGENFQPRPHWGDFTRDRSRNAPATRPWRQRQADVVPPRRERAESRSTARPERVQQSRREGDRRSAPRSWNRDRSGNVDQAAPVEP